MSGSGGADTSAGASSSPALQVIVLGSGGGPVESNTTAFLVRSTAEGWRRGSIVALDAGVMMSSITRIFEKTLPEGLRAALTGSPSEEGGDTPEPSALSLPYTLTSGPFAGLEVPYASASANASFVQSALVDTYLITHPHLDHISGFVINTAGLPGTRPKRLAGLPSTISAFKTHIFNNVIWPNLSDENNGAGLVTFMRLVEGGSPALGDGEGRGYVEISDGLAVKIWGVSHGHCIERHSHRGSGTNTRFGSMDASSAPLNAGIMSPRLSAHQPPSSSPLVPQTLHHHQQLNHPPPLQQQQQQTPQQQQQAAAPGPSQQPSQQPPQSQQATPLLGPQRRDSLALLSGGGSVAAQARRASLGMLLPQASQGESICVYDSSAYFIRDVKTGREVLMFGDVEPDSISLSPRNGLIWQEAAPKIAAGNLAAIFVECSYDDSQPLDRLYGHLTPRFVAEEMANLAAEVAHARIVYQQQQEQQKQQQRERDRDGRKRKRYGGDDDRMSISNTSRTASHSRRKTEALETQTTTTAGEGSTAEAAAVEAIVTELAAAAEPVLEAPILPEDPVSPRTVKPVRMAIATSAEVAEVVVPPPVPLEESSSADILQPEVHHPATPATHLSLTEPDPSQPSLDDEVLQAPSTAPTSIPDVSASVMGTGEVTEQPQPLPLRGLKVVIIHIKEKLRDGPPAGEIILEQLREHEERNPLGCEYIISYAGQSLFF
ncbi:3',5'-cyclic-nucleotide phosphodiesterase pde1 [Sporothrix stenoceras]|uniref:3',5'-cyclic-nucleotide phosphodiesterase pde1 n=1 Tax=Sporothrix stenoceras TaxID=5173 RepID=A0ABR3Z132_9PEZI